MPMTQAPQHREARALRRLSARVALLTCTGLLLGASPSMLLADDAPALQGADVVDSTLLTLGSPTGAVSTDVLEANRAKAGLEIDKVFINDQELNGSVSGNVAINTRSGANVITDAAFSDASGIINSIQNTGNNVLIQSATIVNVSIEQ